MNRIHHLKHTLPANLNDNKDYSNLEFLLLDYNSSDRLEEFVKETMGEHIRSGRLVYYKTCTPKYFNRSHSRNLAFKLAQGDILCNIDADNYTGKGFASYVNAAFTRNEKIFLTTLGLPGKQNKSDVFGRNCFRKKDFVEIGGFDERMTDYGFEDYDLAARLEARGLKRTLLQNPAYLKALPHDNRERISKETAFVNLEMLLFNYITHSSTEFLFLFKKGDYSMATVLDNRAHSFPAAISALQKSQLKYQFSISQENWASGRWKKNGKSLELIDRSGKTKRLYLEAESRAKVYRDENLEMKFYEITDGRLLEEAVFFYSQITNRITMDQNRLQGRVLVNRDGFGKDTVYKNFDYQHPISL